MKEELLRQDNNRTLEVAEDNQNNRNNINCTSSNYCSFTYFSRNYNHVCYGRQWSF